MTDTIFSELYNAYIDVISDILVYKHVQVYSNGIFAYWHYSPVTRMFLTPDLLLGINDIRCNLTIWAKERNIEFNKLTKDDMMIFLFDHGISL